MVAVIPEMRGEGEGEKVLAAMVMDMDADQPWLGCFMWVVGWRWSSAPRE